MKVAVITRTKDRPVFLKRCIQSVARQTFDDYIHVIVNDGGDKNDVEKIINGFAADVQVKIKLFHRDVSSGAPDTIFNESIDRVDSDYFAIHDDDDTWHKDFLATTTSKLDDSPELAAVVVKTDKITERIVDEHIATEKRQAWMPELKVINLYTQCIDNQFTPIATLFRRTAYEKVGKFDDRLPIVGDWEFGVRLLQQFDAEFIPTLHPLAYYHHRKSTGSANDSVSEKEKHRYYTNLVMNRYLRRELQSGQLGVGYIMSHLKYEQTKRHALIKRLVPKNVISLLNKYR